MCVEVVTIGGGWGTLRYALDCVLQIYGGGGRKDDLRVYSLRL